MPDNRAERRDCRGARAARVVRAVAAAGPEAALEFLLGTRTSRLFAARFARATEGAEGRVEVPAPRVVEEWARQARRLPRARQHPVPLPVLRARARETERPALQARASQVARAQRAERAVAARAAS